MCSCRRCRPARAGRSLVGAPGGWRGCGGRRGEGGDRGVCGAAPARGRGGAGGVRHHAAVPPGRLGGRAHLQPRQRPLVVLGGHRQRGGADVQHHRLRPRWRGGSGDRPGLDLRRRGGAVPHRGRHDPLDGRGAGAGHGGEHGPRRGRGGGALPRRPRRGQGAGGRDRSGARDCWWSAGPGRSARPARRAEGATRSEGAQAAAVRARGPGFAGHRVLGTARSRRGGRSRRRGRRRCRTRSACRCAVVSRPSARGRGISVRGRRG
jgi:hypothetical protein